MSENKIYTVEEIMEMLPHRYPFLLVDRLEVEVPGEKGIQKGCGREKAAGNPKCYGEKPG